MGAKARGIAEMSDPAPLQKESHLLHIVAWCFWCPHHQQSSSFKAAPALGFVLLLGIGKQGRGQLASFQFGIYFRNVQCENASMKRSMAFAHLGNAFTGHVLKQEMGDWRKMKVGCKGSSEQVFAGGCQHKLSSCRVAGATDWCENLFMDTIPGRYVCCSCISVTWAQ
jgi:hypothetical protein